MTEPAENQTSSHSESGLFNDTPPSESAPHILNYTRELGRIMSRFRHSQPLGKRSVKDFSEKVLSRYFGVALSRNRVMRAENGDLGVRWGVIAAYLDQINVWPEFLQLLLKGKEPTAHHMTLVHSEVEKKAKQAQLEANTKLNHRATIERQHGYFR